MTVIISGDNGVSDVDGSAGTPAIRGTDANSGIFFGADQVGVATNGVERVEFGNSETVFNDGGADVDFRVEGDTNANLLFVDASTDRVGIGTSSPAAPLQLATAGYFRLGDGTYYHTILSGTGNTSLDITANAGAANAVGVSSMRFLTSALNAGVTEKARITGDGEFCINTTGIGSTKLRVYQNANSNDNSYSGIDIIKGSNNTTTAQVFQRFFTDAGNVGNGSVTANGVSAATFTAYSDRRLKENIQDLPSQLDNICRLKPSEFDYIGYPEGHGHQIGFIAQNMQEVYPDVVAADGEGMLQIAGWSKTEARLVKAIQELKAINDAQASRIETLEAKVAALEANNV